ncbi:MAG: hypothetical protein H0V40_05285 [Actinobacteria bacterium]|nr:hypothetical protein [Actinomycetota bacterium]
MADDPRDSVPDELENRLDDLSSTLTDDEITTAGASEISGQPAAADADGDDGDSDADDTDADADDSDQDADADDA